MVGPHLTGALELLRNELIPENLKYYRRRSSTRTFIDASRKRCHPPAPACNLSQPQIHDCDTPYSLPSLSFWLQLFSIASNCSNFSQLHTHLSCYFSITRDQPFQSPHGDEYGFHVRISPAPAVTRLFHTSVICVHTP